MTPIEFQTLVAKANEALESEEPIPNEDELELLTFIGGYGSAMYYVLLDNNELMARRKTDRNFPKLAYPTQGQKKRRVISLTLLLLLFHSYLEIPNFLS